MNVRVYMQTLTEYGGTDRLNGPEDEVYLIVTTRTPDGKTSVRRIPDKYWDMHPHIPTKQHISDVELWSGEIGEGQSVGVSVLVGEEDAGTELKQIADAALAAAEGSSDDSWILQVAKALTGVLENKDDVIGGFSGKFSVHGGQLAADWIPAGGTKTAGGGRNLAGGPANPQYRAAFFEMRGGDSLFFAYLRP
jgi:hypothetical protein